ncbi:hypothetical protein V8E55_005308 [Tylopilus felleus]
MAKPSTMRPKQVWFQLSDRQSTDSIPEFQVNAGTSELSSIPIMTRVDRQLTATPPSAPAVPRSLSVSHLSGLHQSTGLYDDTIADTLMDVIIPPSPEPQLSAASFRHIVNDTMVHSLTDIILANASQSDSDVADDDYEDVLSGIQLPEIPNRSDEGYNDARTDYLIDIDIPLPPAIQDDAKHDVLSGIVIPSPPPLLPSQAPSADRFDIEMDSVEATVTEEVKMADSAMIWHKDDGFELLEWVKKMRMKDAQVVDAEHEAWWHVRDWWDRHSIPIGEIPKYDVAMVAQYAGKKPIVQYGATDIMTSAKEDTNMAANQFVRHSQERRDLLMEQLELLKLLDIVLSKGWS